MTCKKFVKFFEWCISDNNSSTTVMNNPPEDMDIDSHNNSQEDLGPKVSNRSQPLVILKHYEDNFLYHLKKLIDIFHFSTVESSIFSSLLIRLDYNQYYYHLQSLSIGPSTLNMNLGHSSETKRGSKRADGHGEGSEEEDSEAEVEVDAENKMDSTMEDQNGGNNESSSKNDNDIEMDLSQYSSNPSIDFSDEDDADNYD